MYDLKDNKFKNKNSKLGLKIILLEIFWPTDATCMWACTYEDIVQVKFVGTLISMNVVFNLIFQCFSILDEKECIHYWLCYNLLKFDGRCILVIIFTYKCKHELL